MNLSPWERDVLAKLGRGWTTDGKTWMAPDGQTYRVAHPDLWERLQRVNAVDGDYALTAEGIAEAERRGYRREPS